MQEATLPSVELRALVMLWFGLPLCSPFFAILANSSRPWRLRALTAKCAKISQSARRQSSFSWSIFAILANSLRPWRLRAFKRGVRQLVANAAPEHLLFRFLLSPESMPRAMDKDVFQRGLTHRHRLNLSRKCFRQFRNEAMPVLPLHPNSAAAVFVPQRSRAHVEASGDALRKALGIVGCFNPNHVTTDLVLEFERSTESYELSLIENCKPIATFGFFHQMGCDNHRDLLVITQTVKILPKIAPCARIEPSRGFVEQQYRGMMKQALSQFQPPLHSPGKCLSFFLGALR